MMALLTPFLPYILAALGLIGGAFGVAWGRKTSQTSAAQADAAKAQATAQVAQAQTSVAQSNEAVAQSTAADARMAKQVDESAAALTHEEIQNEVDALRR